MSLHASLETPFIPDLLLLDSFNFLYWLLDDISVALEYIKFGNPRKFRLVQLLIILFPLQINLLKVNCMTIKLRGKKE